MGSSALACLRKIVVSTIDPLRLGNVYSQPFKCEDL
jgi:hypothetical protein